MNAESKSPAQLKECLAHSKTNRNSRKYVTILRYWIEVLIVVRGCHQRMFFLVTVVLPLSSPGGVCRQASGKSGSWLTSGAGHWQINRRRWAHSHQFQVGELLTQKIACWKRTGIVKDTITVLPVQPHFQEKLEGSCNTESWNIPSTCNRSWPAVRIGPPGLSEP